MKYQLTQPQTLNGRYYGIGDTIEDVANIPHVEVLIQNAVLIPVVEEVKKESKVEDAKISVAGSKPATPTKKAATTAAKPAK